MLQLSISYLSFEQPAEESSLCVGQVLGLAPLNRLRARASGAGSLLLPPRAGEPRRACTGGTKREKFQSNTCAESLVWKSRHICSFEIFFKILMIPRATVPSFSKFELMRSPACQIPCAPTQREDAAKAQLSKGSRALCLDPSGVTREKAGEGSTRSRGLCGLQECFSECKSHTGLGFLPAGGS